MRAVVRPANHLAQSSRAARLADPEFEQHYGSESVWRAPAAFMRDFRIDLRRSPELAWQLFLRNIRARYRHSLTGYIWAFVPPLAWAALFLTLQSSGQLTSSSGHGYTGALVVGLVFWQLFVESMQTPLRTFAEARSLLAKLKFPRESLIAAALLEVLFQFAVRVPLLVLAWIATPGTVAADWWLLPVSVAGIAITGGCIGIALLPFSLLYEDVAPALALATGFWLLITPIAYAPPSTGIAGTLAALNPASALVNSARAWWLGFGPASPVAFATISCVALAAALIGWSAARVAFPHLAARFGS